MSIKTLSIIFLLLAFSATLCLGQVKLDPPYWYDDADDDPTVYFLSSNDVTANGYLAIYGDDFGSSGTVTLNGTEAPVESWSYRKIVIRVPEGSAGPVRVEPQGAAASAPFPVSVHGGTVYHLDAGAPDGGDGSAASPWNLFETADDNVSAGDFVVIHGGIYRGSGEYNWDADTSGNAGNSITYFALPGAVVEVDGSTVSKIAIRIDASYVNMVGVVARTSQSINLFLRGSHSRAVDCEVKDGDGSVSTKGQGINIWATGAKSLGNYIHDNYSHGFYVHADDMEIGYNYVANSGCCGAPASYGYGIQLYLVDPGPTFHRGKVYRNYVTSSNRSGIVVGLYSDGADIYENIVTGNTERGLIINYGATDTTIRNNVFYNNDTAGAGYYEVDLYNGSGVTVTNNAISGPLGVRKRSGFGGSIQIDSNLYDGTSRWDWNSTSLNSLAAWQAGSGMDSSSQAASPDYRAPGSDDFRPDTGSPLIDAGDNATCARPHQGVRCDQGAFETSGNTEPPAPPSTPGNLERTDKKL